MLGWGRLVRRVPARSQTGQPSQKHSSLCPPAPPSGLPWELSSQSPSAPLPLPGSRLQAGGGRNRAPSLEVLVPSQTPAGLCGSQQGDPRVASSSTLVGGLAVAVLTWVSSPHGARAQDSQPTVSSQAVPGPPSARGLPGGPLSPARSAARSSGRRWHLLPYLGRGASGLTWQSAQAGLAAHVSPACVQFVELWEAFFPAAFPPPTPPPRSHHDPVGSASGAGGGNTDTQRVLLPLGGREPGFPGP